MFKHLLIPLDGSELAEAVLPAAGDLAARAGARVTLLHVIERKAPESIHGQHHLREVEEAEEYLREAARRFPAGVEVNRHVHAREVRDVAHSLVDHADEMGPDLVVMCSHGEGRPRDWLTGNIPQQVVHQGQAPVLLLRKGAGGEVAFPFRRVLLPLDGAPEHEQGLAAAESLAHLCGAEMKLVRVVPTVSALTGEAAASSAFLPESTLAMLSLEESEGAEYLAPHLERLRAEGIAATALVCRGDPCEMIAEAGEEWGADLVALGTHGRAGTDAFWSGSLAQRLIRRLPVSFLLTPVGAGRQ